ncbi:MAG: hypothetical protein ACI9X4_002989 [Glaciecola sp.]|jgi:hypothetical protein
MSMDSWLFVALVGKKEEVQLEAIHLFGLNVPC